MTAKEYVKSVYPKARKERHTTGTNETYYLIRNGNEFMYIADGKTESKAWVKAKEIIINNLKNKQQ